MDATSLFLAKELLIKLFITVIVPMVSLSIVYVAYKVKCFK